VCAIDGKHVDLNDRALARSLRNEKTALIGNFWSDLNRSCLYLFLPLSILFTLFLVHQGVIQNFLPYQKFVGFFGGEQILPMGPAASQIAIKQLGTNGGGFFGVNSAHPFENPTPFSNFLQMFAILMIPAALPFAFGKLTGNFKHGVTLFIVMLVLFILSLAPALYFENQLNPINGAAFLEGKETRFGIGSSILWGITTTAASNGSVNAMLSSFSPMAGMFCMLNIMLGEIIFGGVGSGLYGMVLFVILTVFIAGLMVGRTPEYLGKKIEAADIKPAVIGVVLPSLIILIFSAIACSTDVGLNSLLSKGPHGLSEILYAFASAAGNNGSAFAGLNANTNFYNILTAIAMLIGRFGVIIPVFIIAGNLSQKKKTPYSLGTFQTEGLLFGGLLISIILIVGALTFFPALCLGPIMEHLLMLKKVTF
jgi:K+-transporting ATPase ATPase A chain